MKVYRGHQIDGVQFQRAEDTIKLADECASASVVAQDQLQRTKADRRAVAGRTADANRVRLGTAAGEAIMMDCAS